MNCLICNWSFETGKEKRCGNCRAVRAECEALIDSADNISQAISLFREIIVSQGIREFSDEHIFEIRSSLYISHDLGLKLFEKTLNEFRKLEKYIACTLEFDENLTDAYAGGDTLLRFQFTNNSGELIKSVELDWDDKETAELEDYKVKSSGLISRNAKAILEGTHVFSRQGPKTIGGASNDLFVTIDTMVHGKVKLKTSPFSFTVGNPNQTVFNSVSNNTSINVEAERVVGTFDASKTGASPAIDNGKDLKGRRWVALKLLPCFDDVQPQTAQIEKLSSTVSPAITSALNPPDAKPVPEANTDESPGFEFLLSRELPTSTNLAAEDFVLALQSLSSISPSHPKKSVLTALDLSLELIQAIAKGFQEIGHDDILGVLLLNPESAFLDAQGYVCGFDGVGYVFTPQGILHTKSGSHSGDYALMSWTRYQEMGFTPHIRRYSATQFLVFLGDKTGQSVPGFSFDLRRYSGPVPVEKIYQRMLFSFEYLLQAASEEPEEEEESSFGRLVRAASGESEQDDEKDLEDDADEGGQDSSVDLRDRSNIYVADDKERAVRDLLRIMEWMVGRGPEGAYKVCDRSYISQPLLDVICEATDTSPEEFFGLVFEDSELVEIDEDTHLVTGFSGGAAVFGLYSVDTITSDGALYQQEEIFLWEEFSSEDIQFFRYGDPGNFTYALAVRDGRQIKPTVLYFHDVDCDEPDHDGYSINNLWERGWDILAAIREACPAIGDNTVDEILEDDEEDIEPTENQLNERRKIALETGNRFFSLLSFALQRCWDGNQKGLFTADEIQESHIQDLYQSLGESGTSPYAIATDPAQVEFSSDGKVIGWRGFATVISTEGVFHMVRNSDGAYSLDGKNAFLSWKKMFADFSVDLHIRDGGPDLWFGTSDKVLIRSAYCDYSNDVMQWDYFEDFLKSELIDVCAEFKSCYL
jgi:hypothetical protein